MKFIISALRILQAAQGLDLAVRLNACRSCFATRCFEGQPQQLDRRAMPSERVSLPFNHEGPHVYQKDLDLRFSSTQALLSG